jgi:hypothetical protein
MRHTKKNKRNTRGWLSRLLRYLTESQVDEHGSLWAAQKASAEPTLWELFWRMLS